MSNKLTALKNAATSKAGLKVLKLRKASPNIMFGVGVAGMVTTVVLASRATLRVEEVLDDLDKKKSLMKDTRDKDLPDYDEVDYKQDISMLHIRQAGRLIKLYSPAIAVGVVSVSCLTGAHVTLTRRNTAAVAAYAALDKSFREYRGRVLNDLGVEKDLEYKFGSAEMDVETENKKGEKVVRKEPVAAGASMYAVYFDERNPNFSKDNPENNLFFLKLQQAHLQNTLQARGHVLLNDVYDALGMERTTPGCIVGWVKGRGDDHVDFGIWDDTNVDGTMSFLRGQNGALLLDFNVDGVIYDLI